MKKLFLITSVLTIMVFPQTSKAGSGIIPDDSLMKMDIVQVCNTLGIPSEYNKRYEAVIVTLCDAGIYLFDAKTNPGCTTDDTGIDGKPMTLGGRPKMCYCYTGSPEQNEILKRNLIKNRNLITNGKINPQNAKLWKIIG